MVLVNLFAGQEETQTQRTDWWTAFVRRGTEVGQTGRRSPVHTPPRGEQTAGGKAREASTASPAGLRVTERVGWSGWEGVCGSTADAHYRTAETNSTGVIESRAKSKKLDKIKNERKGF